jgi:hypothetical protein
MKCGKNLGSMGLSRDLLGGISMGAQAFSQCFFTVQMPEPVRDGFDFLLLMGM